MPSEKPYACKGFCTRQRVNRSPSPSASETSSSSAGSTRARPATIVSAAAPPGELGIEREEELVHEPGGEQVRVERRASLAEDRAHAVLLAQAGHQDRQVVTAALVLHLLAEAGQAGVGAGGDHHALLGLVEQREVGGQVEPAAHHHGQRVAREALALALVAQLLRLGHAPVALDPHRARPHEHGVGLGAQLVEELAIELGREALGAPFDRGLAVEARDHVEHEIGPPGGRPLAEAKAGRELAGAGGAALGVDQLHAAAG